MNITTKRQTPLASVLACVGLLLIAGQAAAAEYWLCAKAGNVTMPDGAVVPIWGYVQDDSSVGGNLINNLSDGCAGTPTLPGPPLAVPADDLGLTVHLRNDLTAPTSIVIPGQIIPSQTAMITPVKIPDAQGRPRVRSFTHEAAASGGTADYIWANIKPGTYLYHSGTHPQVQVQMGLYGAVVKNFLDGVPEVPAIPPVLPGDPGTPAVPAVPAEAYDGVPFGAELTLLFSEIDPAQHAAIAAGTFGTASAPATPCKASVSEPMPMTSTLCYKPKYFLVNGKPYPDSNVAMPTLSVGQATLLRLLNAGLQSYVPAIQGTHMMMVAEDGNRYQYRDAVGEFPRDQYQYSTLLASLKTTDAVITPASLDGTVIYDRRLHLVNNLAQDGGMFVKLNAICGASCTDLSITKSDGLASVNRDTPVTYSIVVSNAGPTAVTGAQVTDNLPAALAASATWTCTPAGGAICAVASGVGSISAKVNLPVGDSVTFSVTGTVDPLATGSLVNIASVATPAGMTDPNPANNSATDTDTVVLLANLSVTKDDGVTSVTAGGPVSYTITVSNAGPDPATGATVTDTLPAAITGATWTCAAAGGATCAAGGSGNLSTPVNLPAGGSATFTVSGTLSATATGSLVNTASVATPASVSDTDPADNSATDTDAILLPPVYFSTATNTAVPGVAGPNDNADIYVRNPDGSYTRLFDATAFGVPGAANVDAFVYNGPSDIYLSFTDTVNLPGLAGVQDEDIVSWNGTAWSLYFDGSDAGLGDGGDGEDVDAFAFLADGSLLVSTRGNPIVPGLPAGTPSLADEDLLRCAGTFGPTTTCTWSLYFDSSDVALSVPSEDVDFARVAPGGDIQLSTLGAFSASYNPPGPPPPISLSGTGNQVFACTSPTTGTVTACAGFSNVLTLPTLPTGTMDAINLP